MSDEVKFSPDERNEKSNLVGKIIASCLFSIIGILFVYFIYAVHNSLLVPAFVLLVTGFIIMSIWLEGLYIYRYLLPAMIIIMVFTAYPIIYTVAIAFTNYGTGHLLSSSDVKKDLLKNKWEVNDDAQIYYAEIYAPQNVVDDFLSEYNKEYSDFFDSEKVEKMDEDKAYKIWVNKENVVVDKYFGKLTNDKYKILVYTTTDFGNEYSEDEEVEEAKVYVGEYNKENKQYETKAINFEDIEQLTLGYELINDKIYFEESEKESEEESWGDDEEAMVASSIIGVLSDFEENLRIHTPLIIEGMTYRLELGNEFVNKEHSFIEDKGQLFIRNGNAGEVYTTKIFPASKEGVYVATKDNKKPEYWGEYVLTDFGFKYGTFNISSNSEAEAFLSKVVEEKNLAEKLVFPSEGLITGKKVQYVSKEDIARVKDEIAKANDVISEVNRNIKSYKKQFLKEKKARIEDLNKPLVDELNAANSEIISLKDQVKGLKKHKKSYSAYKQKKEKELRIKELVKRNKDLRRQIRARKQQSKNIDFPSIAKIKIIQVQNSNIDNSISIEPGYISGVGFGNFKKIISSKSITAPFFRVFIWTIAWAALATLSTFAVGLLLAMIFNAGDFKGKYFYRTIFILPYAIPAFVTVLMWSGLLNDDFGVINLALDIKVPWLMDPKGWVPKLSVLLVNLWLGFPYMMLISLGALQSIDASMYEAAEVDGANKIQQFFLITLPLLLLALGPMLVGSFAFAFNNFGAIYLLTQGRPVIAGGVLPGHTDILISYTYKLAFGQNEKDYGLASAIAIIVFLIIGSITFFNFKFTGAFEEVENA